MKTDMWSSLGSAERSLHTATREGQEVRVLTIEKHYGAPRPEVWHAVTTGERISRWLGPVTGDLRLGGRYQVEGNAGGTVLQCAEPELLEVTWEYGGDVTWVLLTLATAGSGTRLRLEHSAPVDEVRLGEFGPGAVGIGWELALGGLRLHLADPDFTPGEPDYTDPGYPAFVRASGDAWAEADITSGTDPAQARAAAERCFAAYTTLPEPQES
jgi:uncharacterized protein YndB with AHSA1/START domain